MSDDFSEMDAAYGSEPEFPDVRHETVEALKAEIERLRAALEMLTSDETIIGDIGVYCGDYVRGCLMCAGIVEDDGSIEHDEDCPIVKGREALK